jgi:hypothetical protein
MVNNVIVVRIPNLEINRCTRCSHPQPFSQHREKGVSFGFPKARNACFEARITSSLDFSSLT